jgi:hypothetical protein
MIAASDPKEDLYFNGQKPRRSYGKMQKARDVRALVAFVASMGKI